MTKVLAALALSMAFGANALAYELKTTVDGHPVHWPEMPVPYAIDVKGPRDMPLEDGVRAIRGAFETWARISGSAVAFDYQGELAGEEIGYDRDHPDRNHNLVTWSRDEWAYDLDALAITSTLYRRTSGKLVDGDIVINERTYAWGYGEDAENDPQNAITHEIGHFLGFGHSEIDEATMYPSATRHEVKKRTLHDDDINAALRVYPVQPGRNFERSTVESAATRDDSVPAPDEDAAPGLLPPEPAELGCAVSGGPGSDLAPLALLLLAIRRKETC